MIKLIKLAQELLNEMGNDAGPVDGILGPKTSTALNQIEGLPSSWNDKRKLIGFIQKACKEYGIDSGVVDGLWGSKTETASNALNDMIMNGRTKTHPYGNKSDGEIIDEAEDDDKEAFNEKQAFEKALKLVLRYEGGYVNDPSDPGGATNKGVTTAVYNAYRESKKLPLNDVRNISDREVEEIYYKRYWLKAKCDQMHPKLAVVHFDTAVNTGTKQSAKFLQRSVGAIDDGIIGPKTLDRINNYNEQKAINNYLKRRRNFYKMLANKRPKLEKFLKGWLKRVDHLEHIIQSF